MLSVGSSAAVAVIPPFALAVNGIASINSSLGNNNPIEILVPQKQSTNVVSQEMPVEVTLRSNEVTGNEWIDIKIPGSCSDACQQKILAVCEEFQNLWQHGYRDSNEEREKKKALGVKPENNRFRMRISYSLIAQHGLPPEEAGFNIGWQCGLFYDSSNGILVWDSTIGDFVSTTSMELIHNLCHECAEKVASELNERLTKLVKEISAQQR